MVEISWGFVIASNNVIDGLPCYLQSSLVSDEQIQTIHIKRDQFYTIAGYPILIQMSMVLNHNINFETKIFKWVWFGGNLRRAYK